MAKRTRALGLALVIVSAYGGPTRADSLMTSVGWGWWVGDASRSSSASPIAAPTFAPALPVAAPLPVPVAAPLSVPYIAAMTAQSTTTQLVPYTASVPPQSTTPQPAPTTAGFANGFINFGTGPYPSASAIASGNPQPWYTSPQVAALFGGTPTAGQQASFTSAVLQLTEQAFQQSGVAVNLTTDPSVPAAHTLSVVSGSTSIPFPNAIGTTQLGQSGFSFIDLEAKAATSVGQLEVLLAHNIAHELMLAFGVPEKFDQTGKYLDSTNVNMAMMTNPNATFSPAAAQAINQALLAANPLGDVTSSAQYMQPQATPEPATLIGWGLGLLAVVAGPRLRARRPRVG